MNLSIRKKICTFLKNKTQQLHSRFAFKTKTLLLRNKFQETHLVSDFQWLTAKIRSFLAAKGRAARAERFSRLFSALFFPTEIKSKSHALLQLTRKKRVRPWRILLLKAENEPKCSFEPPFAIPWDFRDFALRISLPALCQRNYFKVTFSWNSCSTSSRGPLIGGNFCGTQRYPRKTQLRYIAGFSLKT